MGRYPAADENMSDTVHALTKLVPEPQLVQFGGLFVYRYVEKTPQQAIVQKLARYVSTLRATDLLCHEGFVQEQAALQRVLDEIQEDIKFLALGLIRNDQSRVYQDYLDAFYQEEFDPKTGAPGLQNRPMIPRQKIRAEIARMNGLSDDPSSATANSRVVSKFYSGYVHAASPHIMDMYSGTPPRFYLGGMKGTKRHDDHCKDLWNYYYRGLVASQFASKALGAEVLYSNIAALTKEFALQDP